MPSGIAPKIPVGVPLSRELIIGLSNFRCWSGIVYPKGFIKPFLIKQPFELSKLPYFFF